MQTDDFSLESFLSLIDYEWFDNSTAEARERATIYYNRQIQEKAPQDVFSDFLALQSHALGFLRTSAIKHVYFAKDGHVKADTDKGPFNIEKFIQESGKAKSPSGIKKAWINALEKSTTGLTTKHPEEFKSILSLAVRNLTEVTEPVTKTIGTGHAFNVAKKNEPEINVYVQAGLDPESARKEGITIPGNIKPFDLDVLDAVVSLFVAGNRVIWAEQIASVLKGKRKIVKVHDPEIKRIKDAVEKLRFTPVFVDATAQFTNQKGYIPDSEQIETRNDSKGNEKHVCIYNDNILHLEGATVDIKNGKRVDAWQFISDKMPVLYRYSDRLGQVTQFPINLLDTGNRSDETTITARNYMLREIQKMKSKHRHNNKMLFETILSACGIDKPSDEEDKSIKADFRQKKSRLKKIIPEFCEHWIAAKDEKGETFISGYTMQDDGITIFL